MKLERRDTADAAVEMKEKPEKPAVSSKKREISVIIYTTVLFAVALALILLSYCMQKSANSAISDMSIQHGEFGTQAMRNIEELQDRNAQLTEELKLERSRESALLALVRFLGAPEGEDLSGRRASVEAQIEYLDGEALEIYNSNKGK